MTILASLDGLHALSGLTGGSGLREAEPALNLKRMRAQYNDASRRIPFRAACVTHKASAPPPEAGTEPDYEHFLMCVFISEALLG